jgi:hypothetical protein
MVNPISLPSWREDQPSSLESTLTGMLPAHPGMISMLIPEQTRRFAAQSDYHDYLQGVNDLQMQNMRASQGETALKEFTGLVQHDPGGALAAARSIPGIGQYLPPAGTTGDLEANIAANHRATNLADLGKAAGGGLLMDPSILGPGVVQGQDPRVLAQAEANKGRIGAAAIGASKGNQGYTESVSTPDISTPFNTVKVHTPLVSGGRLPPSVLPPSRTTTTPTSAPALPPAQRDVSSLPVPQEQIDKKMIYLKQTNAYAHDQVLKAIRNNGGKPILGVTAGGVAGLRGADGIVY